MPRRCLCVLAGALLSVATPAMAQNLGPVTLGAGLQTSFVTTDVDEGDAVAEFKIPSARLYVNGPVTDKIKFMFNTEYQPSDSDIEVLDAVAQIGFSPKFNIWMGRFLPPSDRANLYGPYYSNHWAVYTDGIQDGYPFLAVGRDNGVMYWGQLGMLKLSAGLFDGATTTGNTDVLTAFRAQVDLWDPEDGYYLNGTYYGAKDLLAAGFAMQLQDGDQAWNFDFLLEKKLASAGVVSIEAQYNQYDGLGGYDRNYEDSDGYYVLGAYLFPQTVGIGKIQLLAKYADADFDDGLTAFDTDYSQKTTEINFNYIIKDFNARMMIFFKNTDFDAIRQSFKQFGVGLQIQM